MSTAFEMKTEYDQASLQNRIDALYDHMELFEGIAEQPQIGICLRYRKELAMVSAYTEGEVSENRLSLMTFLREHAHNTGATLADKEACGGMFHTIMREYRENLYHHDRISDISRRGATSPVPPKTVLDKYRSLSSVEGRSQRAANGQMLDIYGNIGDPVPPELTTVYDDDFDPMARMFQERLMNPFVEYVARPLIRGLRFVHILRGPQWADESILRNVDSSTIVGIAKAAVSMFAILSLAVPIGTLDTIQRPELRIIVMTLFSMVYALSAQFMGSRSIPLYTLITAYFQVMTTYVGSTSERR